MSWHRPLSLAVAVVGLCVLLSAGSAVAATTSTTTPAPVGIGTGTARVINLDEAGGLRVVMPSQPAVELPWGQATAWVPVPAGVQLRLGGRSVSADVRPGCSTSVVAAQGRTFNSSECRPSVVPPDRASLRLVTATEDSGEVELRAGPVAVGRAGFTMASNRRLVPAGPTSIEVRDPFSGELFGTRTVDLRPATAYSAIWAGGGEVPMRLVVLKDGESPRLPANVTIQTDLPPRSRFGLGAGAGLAVMVALGIAAVRTGRRTRRAAVGLCAAAVLGGCGGAGVSGPVPKAGPPRPVQPTQPAPVVAASVSRVSPPAAVTTIDGRSTEVVAVGAAQLEDLGSLPPSRAGWASDTVPPGADGVAVLVGHVGGAFGDLVRRAGPGTQVEVVDRRGGRSVFAVSGAPRTVRKGDMGDEFAWRPGRSVLLVTCAGPRRGDGHRRDNLVAVAVAGPVPGAVVSGI